MSDATNLWEGVPDRGGVGAGRLARAPGVSSGASVWELSREARRSVDERDPDAAEYQATGKLAAIVGGQHRYHRTDDAVEHAGPD